MVTGLAVLIIALSCFTFVAYALDKHAARQASRRVSERGLHLLALLGGWPGALIAQQVFRHKTRKQSFRRVFRLTVIAHVLVTALLLALGDPAIRAVLVP